MNKLHLSTTDTKIGGVCGGLSESFGISSDIIRIAFILGLLVFGNTILIYLLLWLVLPRVTNVEETDSNFQTNSNRIYRDYDDRIIGGVCSGLAQYMNWDVSLVRVLTIGLVFYNFFTVLIYFAMWMFLPLKPIKD